MGLRLTLACLCAFLWCSPAAAQPEAHAPAGDHGSAEEEAREHFSRGVELGGQGRWKEACDHFARAHAVAPTGGTRLRLADCYERLDELERARLLYQEILDHMDTEKRPERIDIARERIRRIDERLAERDEEPLPAPAPPASTTPQPPSAPEDPGLSPLPGAILLGAGGAVLVAGAVLGGLALAQESEVRESCTANACPAAQQEQADAASGKALGADVCFGIGGALAATGLVLLIVSMMEDDGGEAVSVAPAGASPAGMVVRF